MKKFISAVLAVTVLATAGIAGAQPYQRQGQDPQRSNGQQGQDRRHETPRGQPGRPQAQPARPAPVQARERRAERRYNAPRYQGPRGYQARHWRHGQRLPSQYRSSRYVVNYRTYHLAPPPRGYHYVRVGNDVVLVAIAGGLISLVLMDLFN